MDRKVSIKTLLLGSASIPFLGKKSMKSDNIAIEKEANYSTRLMKSPWHRMPDMTWTGTRFWANRLQDWQIRDGKLECLVRAEDRTVYCLTHQLGYSRNRFQTAAHFAIEPDISVSDDNHNGFRLGAKGKFQDYRSAAIYGKGLDAGVTTSGHLFIGKEWTEASILMDDLQNGFILDLQAEPRGMNYVIRLTAFNRQGMKELANITIKSINPEIFEGSIALISDFQQVLKAQRNSVSCRIHNWNMNGTKIEVNMDQTFGPIYFAQYTQHLGKLRLTAQLAPIPRPAKAHLEIRSGNNWNRIQSVDIDYPVYTARFVVDEWNYNDSIPYRVMYSMPLRDGTDKTYTYEGSIAKEPIEKSKLKALVCSCNDDVGFPDQQLTDHMAMHYADVALFLGDQFYESNGRFGVQRAPKKKAYLDYLRKWYQFGWSYRELFRHRPSIFLPDEHDVFHGNLWGQSGKEAVKAESQVIRQDSGGYMQPSQWVNLVMETQTSHLPAPYDPDPVKNDIHVYYTDWKYGGVSFGIIEDRKFKTVPKHVLPESAVNDSVTGVLSIPEKGEYIQDDAPTQDMDTDGWPMGKRDDLLRLIRKGFALHLCGDQHLPSIAKYGVDDFGDAGFIFTVPALGNHFPRRWWPPVPENHKPIREGAPMYTGNYRDGFDNPMRVYAVADPQQGNLEPSDLYDESSGYGVVTFNKQTRKSTLECYPRYVNPKQTPEKQFKGWPLTIQQLDNFKPSNVLLLPTLVIEGMDDPMVKVHWQSDGELVQIIRIKGNRYQPSVLKEGAYTVQVGDPRAGRVKTIEDVRPLKNDENKELSISIEKIVNADMTLN